VALTVLFRSAREAELLAELKKKYAWAREYRRPFEKQWLVNIAFYLGEQWIYINKTTGQLENAKLSMPPHKVAMVVNLIQPAVRTELAKLTKQRPVCRVVSASSDFDDKDEARVKNAILDHIWRRIGLDSVFQEGLLWAILTGTGFYIPYWNADAGDLIPEYAIRTDEFGNPVLDESGSPIPEVDETGAYVVSGYMRTGEIAVDAVGPFSVLLDPLATDVHSVRWFFRERLTDIDDVENIYGVRVPAESVGVLSYLDAKVLGSRKVEGKNVCVLKEYWERPSRKRPLGAYVVFASDTILYSGDNPYADAQVPLPLAVVRHIPVPGRIYGDSAITQLVPPQVQYNKLRSQLIEVKNIMAWPKILAPKGALYTNPTSRPGEIVEFNASYGRPEFWTPPPMPAYVIRELDRAKEEMIEISGIHEATRGAIPSNVRSGVAIAYITEQDETRLNVTAHSYEDAISLTATYILRLARKYYVEPRVVRIVGSDRSTKVIQFYGRDIPEDVDVHVESGSSMPKSLIAKQQLLLDLWNARVITDPAVMLKLLEFGNLEDLYHDADLDIDQAARENDMMAAGAVPQVEDFHVHELHIREHNKFRKTQRYEGLPPEIKAIFAEHVAAHQQYIAMRSATQVLPAVPGGMPVPTGGPAPLVGVEGGME
jgi:hypothetical protein